MFSAHGLFKAIVGESKHEEPKIVAPFSIGTINIVKNKFDTYIKKYGEEAPTTYSSVNSALSYVPGAKKLLGYATNQAYAKNASVILKDAISAISKDMHNRPKYIIDAMHLLLQLHRDMTNKGEVSGIINFAFEKILNVDPQDMPITDEQFLELKEHLLSLPPENFITPRNLAF